MLSPSRVSAKTGNGTYSIDWIIHVYGMKNQKYVSKDPYNARMLNNALPFVSGTEVGIINPNTQSETGVAILMENAPAWGANKVQMEN